MDRQNLTNQELQMLGYVLCEYDGECETCDELTPEGELFWEPGCYEYPNDGSAHCRKCLTEKTERQQKEDEYLSKLTPDEVARYFRGEEVRDA